MKPFFVYILKCSDGHYYVGHTDDLERRMGQYCLGRVKGYVAKRLPVKLVFQESFESRYEAIAAERKLKGWSRKKKEALMNHGWAFMQGYWKHSRNTSVE